MKTKLIVAALALMAQFSLPSIAAAEALVHGVAPQSLTSEASDLNALARKAVEADVAAYVAGCVIEDAADQGRYSYPSGTNVCVDPVTTGSSGEDRFWWSRWLNDAE